MKRILYLAVLFVVASASFISCDDEETYAEQKEREARQINNWISQHNIEVMSVSDFLKDTITNNPDTGPDKTRNQYVLFPDNGVYMQIVKRGTGSTIKPGETKNMNARFVEIYVSSGKTISMNLYQSEPDVFYVKRTGDNYSASFITGTGKTPSIMASFYGYSVPNAWIMPFPYIKPGMLDGAAKVRLIVPHNQGTQTAAANVYPTFYELTITSQKWQ